MEEKSKVARKLTPEQYEKAKAMWGSGRYRLKDISERFSISIQALQKRFNRDNVRKGMNAEKHAKAVEQAMENSIINEAEEAARLIREEKEVTLRLNEQFRKRLAYEMAKTTKEQIPLAAAEANIKVIERAQRIVDNCYALSSRVLGIDRIDQATMDMPTLRIEEMTADDISEIREAQRKQMAELIEGDLSEVLEEDDELLVIGEDED